MAEQRVRREPVLERFAERVDLVDPLAREDSLAEEVLVDVRHRAGVDVEPGLARVERCQPAPRRRSGADADAWLQDAVPFDDRPCCRVDHGAVERVRNRADEAPSGIARQLGIRVEHDHVARAPQRVDVAHLHREAVADTAQQLVQIEQLAALALPSNPSLLARVVGAESVQQIERRVAVGPVALVQFLDELLAETQDLVTLLRPLP